jgi:quercetin dioxygenase-like cupin family protein
MKLPTLALTAAGVVACALAAPCAAQDMAKTAGSSAKVLIDNEKVRVIELQMAPGAKTGMHSHGDNLVVFISGGEAVQTMADGTTRTMSRKPGEVLWSGPVTHDTQNTGQMAVRSLVIELKDATK